MQSMPTQHFFPPVEDKRVDVSNLDTILSAMGIYLAAEELEVVLSQMPLKGESGSMVSLSWLDSEGSDSYLPNHPISPG